MRKKLQLLLTAVMAAALMVTVNLGVLPETGKAEAAETTLQNPRIVADSSMVIGQKVTWDCVYFGSYPQSEVDSSEEVYTDLQNASDWDSKNEVTIAGSKYRRMKKDDATYVYVEEEGWEEEGHYNWANDTTYHYFRYEPIKWRVLQTSGNRALLLADAALDDKEYAMTGNDSSWKNSRIRNWLNGYGTDFQDKSFISSAFSGAEQQSIQAATLKLSEADEVNDKIFLLSSSEVNSKNAEAYGFLTKPQAPYAVPDEAKRCKPSDYARAMGTFCITPEHDQYADYPNTCSWWLREEEGAPPFVSYPGYTVYYGRYHSGTYGVRPAMWVTLDSGQYTCAGTVCSDEMKGSILKEGDFSYYVMQDGTVELREFYGMKENVTQITIPETLGGKTVTKIGEGVFYGCSSLRSVNIPGNIHEIGRRAFSNCSELQSISIPVSVQYIDEAAFIWCANLRSITILNKDCRIAEEALDNFDEDVELATIYGYRGSTAQAYAEKYGHKFIALDGNNSGNEQKVPTIQPPKDIPVIPAVKEIKKGEKKTVSGGTYTGLGNGKVAYAAPASKNMTKTTIPNQVIIEGKTYPVTAVNTGAFQNCKKLKSVVIGKGITSIGTKAFSGCKSLKKITIKSTKLKKVGKNAFKGIHAKAVIKAPKAKLKAYKKLLKKKGQGKKVRIVK